MNDATAEFISAASKKLAAYGQGRNGPQIEHPSAMSRGIVTPRFNEDLSIRLHQELQWGLPPESFTEAQLDFIESWGGADDKGTFYDSRITAAYKIEAEIGMEPGEYTWPKLAALLRDRKERIEHKKLGYSDTQSQAVKQLKEAVSGCFRAGLKGEAIEGNVMSLCDQYTSVWE